MKTLPKTAKLKLFGFKLVLDHNGVVLNPTPRLDVLVQEDRISKNYDGSYVVSPLDTARAFGIF